MPFIGGRAMSANTAQSATKVTWVRRGVVSDCEGNSPATTQLAISSNDSTAAAPTSSIDHMSKAGEWHTTTTCGTAQFEREPSL